MTNSLKNTHFTALGAQNAKDLTIAAFNLWVQNAVQVGDQVLIEKIGIFGPMATRYAGPHPVLLTTGVTRWMHVTQIKLVPSPACSTKLYDFS